MKEQTAKEIFKELDKKVKKIKKEIYKESDYCTNFEEMIIDRYIEELKKRFIK